MALNKAQYCLAMWRRYLSSLSANDHRLSCDQRLEARVAESGFPHPTHALGAAIAEPGSGPDQHIQARQQSVDAASALVVDQHVVDDDRAAFREGLPRALSQ